MTLESVLEVVQEKAGFIVFGVGIAAIALFSKDSIQANLKYQNQQSLAFQKQQNALALSQAARKIQQARKELAEERFEQGCVIVVAENDPEFFTGLSLGKPVIDAIRKVPVAPGTVVCDANGNTGIVDKNNVVSDMAYTGNQKLINSAKKKANARYRVPIQ